MKTVGKSNNLWKYEIIDNKIFLSYDIYLRNKVLYIKTKYNERKNHEEKNILVADILSDFHLFIAVLCDEGIRAIINFIRFLKIKF